MQIRIRLRGGERLRRLGRRLNAPEQAIRKASKIAAETTLNLVSRCFKTATDPYGEPWEAPNDLQITGGIKSYTKVAGARGWLIRSTDEKAIWHHDPQPREAWGGKALPTRLQVPTKGRGLPADWHKQISRALKEALLHVLRL